MLVARRSSVALDYKLTVVAPFSLFVPFPPRPFASDKFPRLKSCTNLLAYSEQDRQTDRRAIHQKKNKNEEEY